MIREVHPLEPYYVRMLKTEVDFGSLAKKEHIPPPQVHELSPLQLSNASSALGRSPEDLLRDSAMIMLKQHFIVRTLKRARRKFRHKQLRAITSASIGGLLSTLEVETAKAAVREDMARMMNIDPSDVEGEATNQALDRVIGAMLHQVAERVYQALGTKERSKLDAMAEEDERYTDALEMLVDYADTQRSPAL